AQHRSPAITKKATHDFPHIMPWWSTLCLVFALGRKLSPPSMVTPVSSHTHPTNPFAWPAPRGIPPGCYLASHQRTVFLPTSVSIPVPAAASPLRLLIFCSTPASLIPPVG